MIWLLAILAAALSGHPAGAPASSASSPPAATGAAVELERFLRYRRAVLDFQKASLAYAKAYVAFGQEDEERRQDAARKQAKAAAKAVVAPADDNPILPGNITLREFLYATLGGRYGYFPAVPQEALDDHNVVTLLLPGDYPMASLSKPVDLATFVDGWKRAVAYLKANPPDPQRAAAQVRQAFAFVGL